MSYRRICFAAAALLGTLAGPAQSQDPLPPAETVLDIANRFDRMTVPVTIAGSDPQPFIIDTGAERSVVSRQFAASLGLAPGADVTLLTMTGRYPAATAKVPALAIGPLPGTGPFEAPLLDAADLGAHGLLGIDQLQSRLVSIDLDRRAMTVRAAPVQPRRQGTDEIVVSARSRFGQLIVTQAYFGAMRVTVVIDTGSAVTVGNSALRRRLARTLGPVEPVQLRSVTGQTLSLPYAVTSQLKIGEMRMLNLPVAFADVPPFASFGLVERPALLLGMDALRLFRRVDIDFANRQVRFALPRGTGPQPRTPLLNLPEMR